MGWTCQHDQAGYCKLLKIPCQPGTKGCTINKNAEGIVFSTGDFEADKKQLEEEKQQIDFAKLAREN